jgi:prepilin-type N-terminal cleavage/methylation domain-containing protein
MQATPWRTGARTRQAPAFSLIELLAVIAIIAVLLVAAVPIFSNSTNNARNASREIIKAHLQQARAHAIATSTATAVAIPVLASGNELGARSLSLFEVELDGGNYLPAVDANGNARLLQRWATLPGNFHFLSAAQVSSEKPTIVDSAGTMPVNIKGTPLTCHIIVFAPNGQIVRPSTEINIATAQAALRGNSLTLTQKNGGKPVFDLLQVNRLTGRTRFVEP